MPNYFTGSFTRNLDEKLGAFPDVLDFGAKADGVILTDGAITSGDNTFESATADFTTGVGNPGDVGYRPTDVGKLIWIEGAGGVGVDLLTTIASVTGPGEVETADAAGATVTAAESRYGTDNTTALQAALDVSTAARGFKVGVPRGVYLTSASVNLTHNLTLEGGGYAWHVWNQPKSLIACCGNVPVLDYSGAPGVGLQSLTIKGLQLRGTRRSGSKGIHTSKDDGTLIEDCGFYKFGDQALHLEGLGLIPHIIHCMATDGCLVRTGRTEYIGVFDIAGYDMVMDRCEVTASAAGEAFGDGYIAAVAIRGTNSFLSSVIGEISQVGIYLAATANLVTMVNVRADLNLGHGFVIDGGSSNFVGCRSHSNGMAADNTYDAFLVNGASNNFLGCQVTYNGPTYATHKYGFETTNLSATGANHFNGNHVMSGACETLDYNFSGTQQQQCIARQTNLDIAGRRTTVIEGDLLVTDAGQLDGDFIQKFTGANVGADAGIWITRPNYGVGYAQLFFSAVDDALGSEDTWMKVSRTGAVIDSVTFPKTVILSVPPSIANYGQQIKQSNITNVNHKFVVSDADVDGKNWEIVAQAGVGWSQFNLWSWNDAWAVNKTPMRVGRTGANIDEIELTADSVRLTGTVNLSTPLSVVNGGTGTNALADHGVLLGSGTAAVTVTGAGTADQVLTSNGAAADPSFKDLAPANFGSQTAKYFLAAPNASAGAPSFRAIVASDVPTLDQNTSGTAAGLSVTLAIASGGTNATSEANARTNLDVYSKAEADALAKFTDRGDPSASDVIHTGLTIDSAWHDLDLSGYGVPDAATAVVLRVSAANTGSNALMMFRKNGNSYEINTSQLRTQVANIAVDSDLTIPLGSGAVIEYWVANAGTWNISIVVKGWLK